MSKKDKILLAVPTYDGKIYCQDEWLKQICGLTHPVDVLIIDNSKTEENYEDLKEWTQTRGLDWKIVYQKPLQSVKSTLDASMQIIRDVFLKGNYTHWFSLESDVFCPPNTIEWLLAHDNKFIGLPYFHGSGNEGTFLMRQDFPSLDNSLKISTIEHPHKSFLDFKGELITCYQGGFGCCLVKREVIETIPFRIADQPFDWFPDAFFHDDCLRTGIPYYISTISVCKHFNDGERWKEVQKDRQAF